MSGRSCAAGLAAACFALLLAVAASAGPGTGPRFGVAEDATKYADDGGTSIYPSLTNAGLTENRWTVTFTGDPSHIQDQKFLDRSVPAAAAAGVDVILSLFPANAQTPDPAAFCQWVGNVATRYRGVTRFIVGNEVNATRFWSPQHTAADPNAGPDTYEATLARCYDVLKGVNPANQVIGMGLAPRAVSDSSTKPLDFIRLVGKAYRASGRTAPIMDALAIHPYPNPNANPPPPPDRAGYEDPGFFGIPQMDRVKQAVYDAFNGTGQPTTLNGLTFRLDEFGWQTTETGSQYTGTENAGPPGSAPAVSEADQSTYLQQSVAMFACDATVTDVELFLLVDEADRSGWQSGLMTAGGEGVSQPKAAYSAVGPLFGEGRAACTTGVKTWSPSGSSSSGGGSSGSGGKSSGSGGKTSGSGGATTGSSGKTSGKTTTTTGKKSGTCTKATKLAKGYVCKKGKVAKK